MKGYKLSTKKTTELETLHRSLRYKCQANRVKAVIALPKGWSAAQIAEILLLDEKTSRNYFERYQQCGLQALLDDNNCGAEPKLDEHQMSKLSGYLEEHIFTDAKSAIAHIYQQYNLRYSVSGVHAFDFFYQISIHFSTLCAKNKGWSEKTSCS